MTRKGFIFASLCLSLLANLVSLLHFRRFGITDFLWLTVIFPVTGTLLLDLFNSKVKLSFGEWISYAVGLSLAFIMALGLLLNTLGLTFHLHPLQAPYTIIVFDVLFAVLLFVFSRRGSNNLLIGRKLSIFNFITKNKFALLSLIFPVISILGAIRLNNGASGIVTVAMLIAMVLYALTLVFIIKPEQESQYTIVLWSFAVALLLSVSMRSNYLIGYDINQEFQVFSATLRNHLWIPSTFPGDTYNACLSITVLPTMLNSFLPISGIFLFKILMQLIFGIVPVITFVIAKKQLKSNLSLAFAAALFVIIQNQFIFEFPALIRQQVALVFFGLLFMAFSNSTFKATSRKVMILIFGLSLVVSHYSTAYVTLTLLLLFIILKPTLIWLSRYWSILRSKKSNVKKTSMLHISPLIVVLLIIFSFFWYGETLQSTGGLVSKVVNSVTDTNQFFVADSRGSFVINTFHIGSLGYNAETLKQLSNKDRVSNGYASASDSSYSSIPMSPISPEPNDGVQEFLFHLMNEWVPLIVKIIIVIGTLQLVISALFGVEILDLGVLAISCSILFLLLVLLPSISQDYNTERLYQQILIVISAVFVRGVIVLTQKFSNKIMYIVFSVVLVGYFVCTSQLASQLVFGLSDINLSNKGARYDDFYVTDGEFDSLQWLQNNKHNKTPVNFDRYSILSALAYTTLPNHQGTLPSFIPENNYVFASSTNEIEGLSFDYFQNQVVTYNFPTNFLNSQKNIIFSDHDSVIYK
jgi:uncharacterized membrane protein